MTRVKLIPKSHKGKNAVARARQAIPGWDGRWTVLFRDSPTQPGAMLVAPLCQDGSPENSLMRWVKLDGDGDFDVQEAVQEPA
jgi:hypothetical protein